MKKLLLFLFAFTLITSNLFGASLELDYMEYSSDANAQAAYVTNGTLIKAIGSTVGGTANFGTSYIRYCKFTADFSVSITSINVYCAVNSNVRVAIYADNAGVPGALLNQSASTAITSGAFRSVSISATSIVSGTAYWLAIQPETTGGATYSATASLGYGYEGQAYGAFPANAAYTDGGTAITVAEYGLGLSLQSYSESTIKTQGSYALKAVAVITDSLNKTLTKTFAVNQNLTGVNNLKISDYALRTGSNYKIGLHDTGGTTTEFTPNIITSNTWQTDNIDLSAVSDANKDNIDTCTITITNADSANTIILDAFGIATCIDVFGFVG